MAEAASFGDIEKELAMLNPESLLRDATVQEIQLELLRRSRWNDLDGERVVASLEKHRDLWISVLLDRQGIPNYGEPKHLLTAGLIKLRDLPQNIWNADTLFILSTKREHSRQLVQVIEEEEWGGMTQVHDDQREIDDAAVGVVGLSKWKEPLLTVPTHMRYNGI